MIINDQITNHISLTNSDNITNNGRSRENGAQKGVKSDQASTVEISSTAQQMSEDAARLERLNAIRQQLAEGTYNISGKDVANKILKVLKN